MADNEKELINKDTENQSNDITKQTAEVDDLITMLKNLEPLEKREVRGILIGLQMAKVAGSRSA